MFLCWVMGHVSLMELYSCWKKNYLPCELQTEQTTQTLGRNQNIAITYRGHTEAAVSDYGRWTL